MHAHDRKLARAGIERNELMEVCPVCGEQRRNSARFCTTCGHRFAADEIAGTPDPDLPPTQPASLDTQDSSDQVISGWPAPSATVSASPWAAPVEDRGGWPAPPPATEAVAASTEVTWADVAATALGSPAERQAQNDFSLQETTFETFEVEDDDSVDSAAVDAQNGDALRQRARTLMRELQDVIEGLTGETSLAGEELASELQISLTQPAGLEGDSLADLRIAAESAQERPRDLDTLTALTAQADTILALIVGYERATAGIERAIESLRGKPASLHE